MRIKNVLINLSLVRGAALHVAVGDEKPFIAFWFHEGDDEMVEFEDNAEAQRAFDGLAEECDEVW